MYIQIIISYKCNIIYKFKYIQQTHIQNTDNNMQGSQQLQAQAYRHYVNRQYQQAIRLYTQALKQPVSSSVSSVGVQIKQAYIQTTIAILYIHINNYSQAHRMLTQLSGRLYNINISNNNNNTGRSYHNNNTHNNNTHNNNTHNNNSQYYLQYLLLLIKISTSLALIELANCQKQQIYSQIDTILSTINMAQSKADKQVLYRSAMKMLFGFYSFQQLFNQTQYVLDNIGNNYKHNTNSNSNNSGRYNSNMVSNTAPIVLQSNSPQILLSSLALVQQLASNLQLAYQLSYKSYQLSKAKPQLQIIPLIISCKHLLHLSQLMKQSNSVIQLYRTQLNKLMNTPEIYGISQQTLFRGYQQKIQYGRGIVQIMMDYQYKYIYPNNSNNNNNRINNNKIEQQDRIRQQQQLVWLHSRVLFKLQQSLYNMQNQANNTNTNRYNNNTLKYKQTNNLTPTLSCVSKQSLIRTLNSLNNNKTGLHILRLMRNSSLVQIIMHQQSNKIQQFIKSIHNIGYHMAWREFIMLPPNVNEPQYINTNTNTNANTNNRDTLRQDSNNKQYNRNTAKFNNQYSSINNKNYKYTNNFSNNNNNNTNTQNNNNNNRINNNNTATSQVRNINNMGSSNVRQEYYKQQQYKKQIITYSNQTNPPLINNQYNSTTNDNRSRSKSGYNQSNQYDRNRHYQQQLERERQRNREQQKQKQRERQRQLQRERERDKKMERQRQKQRQRQRQRSIQIEQQNRKQRQRQRQRQKQRQLSLQRERQIQRQLSMQRQRQRIKQQQYRRIQQQQKRYNQQQRIRQQKREQQTKRQKQIRFQQQQRQQRKQTQKYEQFRSRQDRVISNKQYNKYTTNQRDLSKQQRDISKDDVKYNQNRVSPKYRRKIQHVNIIQKSPRYTKNHSPISNVRQQYQQQNSRQHQYRYDKSPRSQYQQSRVRRVQRQDINNIGSTIQELNSSKVANHMNNVYLDGQGSRFINPLEDMYEERDGYKSMGAGKSNINGGNVSKKRQQIGAHQNQLQSRTQRTQRPQNRQLRQNRQRSNTNDNEKYTNMQQQQTNNQTSSNKNTNLAQNTTNKPIVPTQPTQVTQGDKILNQVADNVMSILKIQNSRTKTTYRQMNPNANPNPNANMADNLNSKQIIQQHQYSQRRQVNTFPTNNNTNNTNMNNNDPYLVRYETPTSNIKKQQNINNNSNVSNRTNNRQHVQYNNVDIIVQPAVNPNNISNLNISNINNTSRIIDRTQQQQQQRQGQAQGGVYNTSPFITPIQPPIISNHLAQQQSQDHGRHANIIFDQYPINTNTNNNSNIANTNITNPSNPYNTNANTNTNPNIRKTPSNQISTFTNKNKKQHEKLTPNSPIIRKFIRICMVGQYFIKRHYSSDGGQEKYLQLDTNQIKWAVDQEKIVNKYQSYKLKDIKGIAYGKVTQTFLKDCNRKLQPWMCFSLILQKRTLDFCCTDQLDPVTWLPGITAALSGQMLTIKYGKKMKSVKQGIEDIPITLYSPGRVLWKRFLLKLQDAYIKPVKKNQRRPYKNANAHAIILWSRQLNKSKFKGNTKN